MTGRLSQGASSSRPEWPDHSRRDSCTRRNLAPWTAGACALGLDREDPCRRRVESLHLGAVRSPRTGLRALTHAWPRLARGWGGAIKGRHGCDSCARAAPRSGGRSRGARPFPQAHGLASRGSGFPAAAQRGWLGAPGSDRPGRARRSPTHARRPGSYRSSAVRALGLDEADHGLGNDAVVLH